MGNPPRPFDILYWNNDTTRLPGASRGQLLDIFGGNLLPERGGRAGYTRLIGSGTAGLGAHAATLVAGLTLMLMAKPDHQPTRAHARCPAHLRASGTARDRQQHVRVVAILKLPGSLAPRPATM